MISVFRPGLRARELPGAIAARRRASFVRPVHAERDVGRPHAGECELGDRDRAFEVERAQPVARQREAVISACAVATRLERTARET